MISIFFGRVISVDIGESSSLQGLAVGDDVCKQALYETGVQSDFGGLALTRLEEVANAFGGRYIFGTGLKIRCPVGEAQSRCEEVEQASVEMVDLGANLVEVRALVRGLHRGADIMLAGPRCGEPFLVKPIRAVDARSRP